MVVVVPGPANLDTTAVSCWTTNDAVLGLFMVFIGQSTTTNVTQSSSRIQSHVFSIGGLQSFPRLTINPSSALYAAVNQLPDADQGDETRRGLAISLLKYFSEMPKPVQQLLIDKLRATSKDAVSLHLFDATHAASLASKMVQTENAGDMAAHVMSGMAEKSLSWIDVDVVLPEGSITLIRAPPPEGRASLVPLPDIRPEIDYGEYNTFVDLLGEAAFLPTSQMRRAPSKPTVVSRTRVLDKDKEDGLRREMQELVATERSYVSRLGELVDSIAANYAREIIDKQGRKLTAGDQAMKMLFPTSLLKIAGLNEQFLRAIEQIVKTPRDGSGNHTRASRDPTGALTFSKLMLEYFPHFKEPYQDYLRKGSQHPKILTELLKDRNSPWANAISASGEQRLKSWLIEPVQRLPRYSLFIDNMVNLLPAEHPAMSRFLRARDVITDICALETDEPINSLRVVQRLRDLVKGWPESFEPSGRLITALDARQLSAPYNPDPYGREGMACVILLFADQLAVLEKLGPMSSRGLLAEIDRPASTPPAASEANPAMMAGKAFALSHTMQLVKNRFLESNSSRLLHVDGFATFFLDGSSHASETYESSEVYQLLGSYDGKASRFSEEITLAMIENRFPEKMRESESWTLKSLLPVNDGLGIITSVLQTDSLKGLVTQQHSLGRTRLVVDRRSGSSKDRAVELSTSGVEILVHITTAVDHKFTIEVLSYGRQASIDTVAEEDFANLLVKRLAYVLRIHNRPFNEEMAHSSISQAREILISIPQLNREADKVVVEQEIVQSGSRRFRPFSPVKGLSSLLAGKESQQGNLSRQLSGRRRGNSVKAPSVPATLTAFQTSSRENLEGMISERPRTAGAGQINASDNAIGLLEDTFTTYIVAMQTRKGNVIGRVIHGRATADELLVNELYNTLIQDPTEHKAAAEVPVDVLFAAFEKFINVAWREQFGVIVTQSTLNDMQSLLFSQVPGMVQQFKVIMSDVPRPNQRAFKSLIGVLAELVGATGNDGDRGALIMTFAEVLVTEGDPTAYITLLDRLLADGDVLLGVQPPGPVPEGQDRVRAANTGSIGSTASSIGKKLGFFSGLRRENSKAGEPESRVTQVLRQLSKRSNTDTESNPPSISRSFLSRGRSADSRPTTPGSSPSRPGSSYSGQGQETSRPGSAHGLLKTLAPIDEGKMNPPRGPVRKKRRSSLSDLTDLRPVQPAPLDVSPVIVGPRNPPALLKSSSTASVMNRGRPALFDEIQPLSIHGRGLARNASVDDGSSSRNTKSPTPSMLPPPYPNRPVLDPAATPSLSPTKSRPSAPQKLKMQSPQKLRERLDREKQAMADAGPELQAELARIGQELASVKVSGSQQPPRTILDELKSRVGTLESLLRARLDDLGRQTDAIQADLRSSLLVSEKKAKSLDELYREANAENELLYERFNGELAKAVRAVRGPEQASIDEMRRQTKEAQDEAARLRKENQRLRRENLGLRSQLKDP